MVRLRTVPFRLYFFREMDCKILISIKARRRNCDLIRHGNQDVKKVKGKLCYALQGGKQSLSLIHSSRKKKMVKKDATFHLVLPIENFRLIVPLF